MNERIKELMLEAGYAAPELAGRANKFAKLIIQECAELVETQHTWITNVAASALIRKHFEVEE